MVGMTFKNHRRSSTMVIVIRSNNVYILHPLKDIRRSLGGLRPSRPSPLLAVLNVTSHPQLHIIQCVIMWHYNCL